MAIKIIDKATVRDEFLKKFLPREVALWPTLRHPNLVAMRQFFEVRNDEDQKRGEFLFFRKE